MTSTAQRAELQSERFSKYQIRGYSVDKAW